MRTLIVNQYLNGLDGDTATYIAAVEAADGQTLEGATKTAINDFVVGCKADGIWDAIKASCILAGARTLAGALTPLVGTAPTNFNFVAGDYDRKTGLKGNRTNKYLNSNRTNDAEPQNDRHISFFAQPGYSATIEGIFIGSSTFATGQSYTFIQQYNEGIRFMNSGDVSMVTFSSNTDPTPGGLYGSSRSNDANFVYRFNKSSQTASFSSVAPHPYPHYVFCRNADGGLASNFTSARLSFYSIGESLDLALLDARVTQLMTNINNAF